MLKGLVPVGQPAEPGARRHRQAQEADGPRLAGQPARVHQQGDREARDAQGVALARFVGRDCL